MLKQLKLYDSNKCCCYPFISQMYTLYVNITVVYMVVFLQHLIGILLDFFTLKNCPLLYLTVAFDCGENHRSAKLCCFQPPHSQFLKTL